MIVYKNSAEGFMDDVDTNLIVDIVESNFKIKLSRGVGQKEKTSWINSLGFMERILRRSNVSSSCGILIEYVIPSMDKRIDFIISGLDEDNNKNFVIIELKQWQYAYKTEKDGIVETPLGKGINETTHPSYQAYSYKLYLKDFNENVYKGDLSAQSCAYLHNYRELNPEPLKDRQYKQIIDDSPLFLKDDYEKLQEFLTRFVGRGNGMDILYEIESGKIRPSKKLVDHVGSMFQGNQEFILLDDQKVAYERAFEIATRGQKKSVLIIKGGPGTGKSVISMNLLAGLIQERKNAVFVAPNAAFREVMVHNLVQSLPRDRIKALFKGSSVFYEQEKDSFDIIIVDEAHRLKNGSAYMYKGDNQIEDIVISAQVCIFFVDDDQLVRPDDIGSVREIKRIAKKYNATVDEMELATQFRCSGAEGYINWLNHTLRIKDTANYDGWDQDSFEFKIFDDPNKLHNAIKQKQDEGLKARLLAGYAWEWTSEKNGNKDAQVKDVRIDKYNFKMPWNSRLSREKWAIDKNGVNQVGCIHTSQGLEFDYVGVLVGDDLRYSEYQQDFYVNWDSYKDSSGKKGLKSDPDKLSKLVRNIYKTLMTRGMKGCYVYFTDSIVYKYFNNAFLGIQLDQRHPKWE